MRRAHRVDASGIAAGGGHNVLRRLDCPYELRLTERMQGKERGRSSTSGISHERKLVEDWARDGKLQRSFWMTCQLISTQPSKAICARPVDLSEQRSAQSRGSPWI